VNWAALPNVAFRLNFWSVCRWLSGFAEADHLALEAAERGAKSRANLAAHMA